MGCWGLLGLLIVRQWIIPENSPRLAQVSYVCRLTKSLAPENHDIPTLSHLFFRVEQKKTTGKGKGILAGKRELNQEYY